MESCRRSRGSICEVGRAAAGIHIPIRHPTQSQRSPPWPALQTPWPPLSTVRLPGTINLPEGCRLNMLRVSESELQRGKLTYCILHPQACCHYRRSVAIIQPKSSRLLRSNFSAPRSAATPSTTLTDKSPCISRLMNLHLGWIKVRGVAEKGQPHVFNVEVVEGLESAEINARP